MENTFFVENFFYSQSGVMIPIPQYPIYSATIDLFGGQKVGYYLDEENGWDLNLKELERALTEARDNGINVNSFVLINPGTHATWFFSY